MVENQVNYAKIEEIPEQGSRLFKVAGGTIKELDRWVDRVLDAPTLDAIFGERRDH